MLLMFSDCKKIIKIGFICQLESRWDIDLKWLVGD